MKQFFEKLDNELNKVDQFYKKREDELRKKRENLNKHLQIILDLNQIFNKRRRKNSLPSLNGGNSPRSWSSPDRSSSFSGEFYHIFPQLIITYLFLSCYMNMYGFWTFFTIQVLKDECGLYPVKIINWHVGLRTRIYSWTRVQILTCTVTTFTKDTPFPLKVYIETLELLQSR